MQQQSTPQAPSLAGAERGRVRPYRPVPGGIWFVSADTGALENVPCALRLVSERHAAVFADYARQYLQRRGDGTFSPVALSRLTALLRMQHALVPAAARPGAAVAPLYPLPELADKDGKIIPQLFAQLKLFELADGQLDRLSQEYDLLIATETPPSLTGEQWAKIVEEGKKGFALKDLVSRHGSSALVQVLHGTDDAAWGE